MTGFTQNTLYLALVRVAWDVLRACVCVVKLLSGFYIQHLAMILLVGVALVINSD